MGTLNNLAIKNLSLGRLCGQILLLQILSKKSQSVALVPGERLQLVFLHQKNSMSNERLWQDTIARLLLIAEKAIKRSLVMMETSTSTLDSLLKIASKCKTMSIRHLKDKIDIEAPTAPKNWSCQFPLSCRCHNSSTIHTRLSKRPNNKNSNLLC